jgi:hypothetical protein
VLWVFQYGAFPKSVGTTVLKGLHATQYSFVHKIRKSPFDGLLHLGADGVYQDPQPLQHRLGKDWRTIDVAVYLFANLIPIKLPNVRKGASIELLKKNFVLKKNLNVKLGTLKKIGFTFV